MPKIKKKAVKKLIKSTVRKSAVVKKILPKKQKSAKNVKSKKNIKVKKTNTNIGIVTHYFPHVQAAVIKLTSLLKIGENIHIKGHTTDLIETVVSMQIDHKPVKEAKKGAEIGLFVVSRVRDGDIVYRPSAKKP